MSTPETLVTASDVAARPIQTPGRTTHLSGKHGDIVREVQAAYQIGDTKAPANPIIYRTIQPKAAQ